MSVWPAKCEQAAAVRQIVRRKAGIVAVGDKARLGDAEEKVLIEERVLNLHAGLEIVVMVDVGVIGLDADVRQLAALRPQSRAGPRTDCGWGRNEPGPAGCRD